MYKLSNLYKRAQYGKGKGKAGLRRVGGGGCEGEEGIMGVCCSISFCPKPGH